MLVGHVVVAIDGISEGPIVDPACNGLLIEPLQSCPPTAELLERTNAAKTPTETTHPRCKDNKATLPRVQPHYYHVRKVVSLVIN